MVNGNIFTRTWWTLERQGGSSVICGFHDRARVHALAKPRGFRTAGTVVRHDATHSWVVDGDTTVETTTTVRTIEPTS